MNPLMIVPKALIHSGLFVAVSLCAVAARADQPLWEIGVGVGALRLPHYRGSEQSHSYVLPVPYLVYRGKIFRSDRDGTRAVLFDSERVDLDISVDGNPPANSSDNRARAGMSNLAPTAEIGPNVNVMLGRGPGWKLDLRMPLRAVVAVRSPVKAVGFTFTPVLNLDLDMAGWNIGLQGGPMAASSRYNAYFYSVDPADATPARPAYRAGSGFAGWGATATASRRLGDWWLAAYVRADSVAGAAFVNSPLITQRNNLSVGLGASWIFKVSDERVAVGR